MFYYQNETLKDNMLLILIIGFLILTIKVQPYQSKQLTNLLTMAIIVQATTLILQNIMYTNKNDDYI